MARPSDRTLWLPPHHGRGHHAFLRGLFVWWLPACLLIPLLIQLFLDTFFSALPLDLGFMLLSSLLAGGLFALVIGFIAWGLYPHARASTRIFDALGFAQPARLSMHRSTQRHVRQQRADLLKYYPYRAWTFRY